MNTKLIDNISSKNRILFVDAAKGFAMILVVLAHSMVGGKTGSLLRGMIYSFHMPLFFILSGYTMKPSKDIQAFVKKKLVLAKKLLLPGVLLFFAWIVIEVLRGYGSISDFEYIKSKLITLLFASANSRECYGIFINGIGMIWFFFVLYGGRSLYDFIAMSFQNVKKKLLWIGVICFVISIVGILIGQYVWLPFSFDIAMGIVPFFFLGTLMKKMDFETKLFQRWILAFLVWAVLFLVTYPHLDNWTYLEVGLRRYSLYPVSYICAFAGTIILCRACRLLEKEKSGIGSKILKPFVFLGKHSMVLLCVHIMDQLLDFVWYYESNQYITFFKRVVVDLLIFAIITVLIDKVSKKYKKN